MSRSEVNQTTAKASLTQMLNVVFQRMEAGSEQVHVAPIVVSDVLGLPPVDTSSVSAFVQSFLHEVGVTVMLCRIGHDELQYLCLLFLQKDPAFLHTSSGCCLSLRLGNLFQPVIAVCWLCCDLRNNKHMSTFPRLAAKVGVEEEGFYKLLPCDPLGLP